MISATRFTRVAVAENAHITHLRVQRESERAFHVGTTQAHQAAHSRYTSFSSRRGPHSPA